MSHQRSPTWNAADWKRSHTCGELGASHVGQHVTLNGWVENRRDHGGLFFVDVRDRYGVTQILVTPDRKDLLDVAGKLHAEDVISASGIVRARAPEQVNKNRSTGEIEVHLDKVVLLSRAEVLPFEILDKSDTSEDLRLQYRYLDIRRRPMARALELRSAFCQAVRAYLASHRFVEVETPILTRSTPEGARDYLVPSRVNPGRFYALPQSPQLFKQLLMVGGLDRYFQIARCFRDEDLRADRQPEFTQIDLEMSYVEEDNVLDMVEGMIVHAFREAFGIQVDTPFPRMDHGDAMRDYGVDKPDMRFGMKLVDVSETVRGCSFKVFSDTVQKGGVVKGISVPRLDGKGGESFSRKDIDELTAFVQGLGAKGLAWAKVAAEGLQGSIAKFFEGDPGRKLAAAMGAAAGDLVLFVADRKEVANKALGQLRNVLGDKLKLRDPKVFKFAWVTRFPLFEWNDEGQRWDAAHHPFTAPMDWDITDFSKDTGSIRSRAYDIVLNGWELGSGSIRIHRPDVQQRVFSFLGVDPDAAKEKFGFLLEAFRYGAPPHGGIALGVDRLVAMALGVDSIRQVIAFPKTASATDLMTRAPNAVDPKQLAELKIASLSKLE